MAGTAKRAAITAARVIFPIAVLFGGWQALSQSGLFPDDILVPPQQVYFALLGLIQDGELSNDLEVSSARVLAGFLAGSTAGLATGLIFGLSPTAYRYFGLLFHVMRQVPFIAWGPLLIVLFGIGEGFKVLIIANAAFFPVALNTLDGVRNVPAPLREVASVFGFSRWSVTRRILLPGALPFILTGLRLGLSRSWMIVVGAELFGSSNGIGHMMEWGREMFELDNVMVGVLVTGSIGFILDQSLRLVEARVSPWKPAGA